MAPGRSLRGPREFFSDLLKVSVRPDGPNGEKGTEPAGLAAEIGQYAGYGLTIGLATAAFAWFGDWLDGRLHTKPLFVVLGAFLGFAGGFYSMYWRLVLKGRDASRGGDKT